MAKSGVRPSGGVTDRVVPHRGLVALKPSEFAEALPRRHHSLDGLRGLTALFVVLHHACTSTGQVPLPFPFDRACGLFLCFGHYAVAVFIVLSGYCLALPVAGTEGRTIRGGFRDYLGRRARRILPPYYAALFGSLALIAAVPALARASGRTWDAALPALRVDAIVSHLLLVHNVTEGLAYKIDPPLWSVATEWQIYFAFPLLLGLWRRFGVVATVALACATGFGLGVFVEAACPWYLGLFAFGMAAASADAPRVRPWSVQVPWLFFAVAAAGLLYALTKLPRIGDPLRDGMAGAATACLILHCTRRTGSAVSRALGSPWVVGLGTMSYSLYLTHFPLLALVDSVCRSAGLDASGRWWALIAVGTPFCLVAAWGFHLVFERPFMNGWPSRRRS